MLVRTRRDGPMIVMDIFHVAAGLDCDRETAHPLRAALHLPAPGRHAHLLGYPPTLQHHINWLLILKLRCSRGAVALMIAGESSNVSPGLVWYE